VALFYKGESLAWVKVGILTSSSTDKEDRSRPSSSTLSSILSGQYRHLRLVQLVQVISTIKDYHQLSILNKFSIRFE